jgi:HSP20 family molecular chaperone IbpA
MKCGETRCDCHIYILRDQAHRRTLVYPETGGFAMSDVPVQKVAKASERTLPIFQEVEAILERIRERAFSFAARRGFHGGRDLDDWLAAERIEGWLASELTEQDGTMRLSVALPGYEPKDITVTAAPGEIIVKACRRTERSDKPGAANARVHWSEFSAEDVYRRVELPQQIDVAKCTAQLDNGMLIIEAPRSVAAPAPPLTVPISSASRAA